MSDQHDSLPVLAGPVDALDPQPLNGGRELPVRAPATVPTVQAAAAAAGGFLAGAAFLSIVHRRQRRALAPTKGRRGRRIAAGPGRRGARAAELVQIVGSRSLLVDVHLLGER